MNRKQKDTQTCTITRKCVETARARDRKSRGK